MGAPEHGYVRPAVAGSGAIALGLAASASTLGEVRVLARSDTSAWRADEAIEKLCGKINGADAKRVRVTTSPNDLEGCDLVVEAIVEDAEARRRCWPRSARSARMPTSPPRPRRWGSSSSASGPASATASTASTSSTRCRGWS